jgi:hypothetical protein
MEPPANSRFLEYHGNSEMGGIGRCGPEVWEVEGDRPPKTPQRRRVGLSAFALTCRRPSAESAPVSRPSRRQTMSDRRRPALPTPRAPTRPPATNGSNRHGIWLAWCVRTAGRRAPTSESRRPRAASSPPAPSRFGRLAASNWRRRAAAVSRA